MRKISRIRERFGQDLEAGRVDRAVGRIWEVYTTTIDRNRPEVGAALVCAASDELSVVGRSDAALELIERALGAISAVDGTAATARGRLLAARAGSLRTLRRSVEALDDQDRARGLLGRSATAAQLATLDHDHAVLLADTGARREAVEGLVAARDAFLAVRDRVGVAAADHNLAFVLHDMGALDDALEYLNEARDIFLATGLEEEAASCDQNLGVVFYDAGRLADAGRRFMAARRRFVDNDATIGAAECDANLSTVLEAMGHHDEAEQYRRRATDAGVGVPAAVRDEVPAVGPDQPSRSGTASA